MSEVIISQDNFEEEVLKCQTPVLVDFWATWCGPCKMIAPHVAKISEEFAGKIKVCKVDVDQCPDLAQSFNVSSIPTILIFKNGEIVADHVGAAGYTLLQTLVSDNL